MTVVRPLQDSDVGTIVNRVTEAFAHSARRQPLLSPDIAHDVLASAFLSAVDATWVATNRDSVIGHLHANVLDDDLDGRTAWTGPDGFGAETRDAMRALLEVATPHWRDAGVRQHHVWLTVNEQYAEWWQDQGYVTDRTRAARRLRDVPECHPPDLYRIRRGRKSDIDVAISLDAVLERDQSHRPASDFELARSASELRKTLSDASTRHFVISYGPDVVGQAISFKLDLVRGNHPRTILISDVVVLPDHRRRGVARAIAGYAIRDAWERGSDYAQVTWHDTNTPAESFWKVLDFTPVYRRFSRDLTA